MTPELALRASIWIALLAWALSEVMRRAASDRAAIARGAYAGGALLLILHIALAFQYRHGWSHAAAFAATAARSEAMTGFASGAGIYLNYLFAAVWAADAAWWLARPRAYRGRSRAIDMTVFAFFVFMFVNGAVVFAAGPMRLAGAVAIGAAAAARLAFAAAPRVRRAA